MSTTMKAETTRRWAALATFAAFTVIVPIPIAGALLHSVYVEGAFTLQAYQSVLGEVRQWKLLANSFAVAAGAALFASILGFNVGLAIEYFRIPGRKIIMLLAAVPILAPPYVLAIAWIDLLGQSSHFSVLTRELLGGRGLPLSLYSLPGVVLVQSLIYFPIVTAATVAACRRLDARGEEAALLTANPYRTFRQISWPYIAPYVLTGTLFVFTLTLLAFPVPSLLQVNVYPVEIYTYFNAFHDTPRAVAQALPLAVIGLILYIFWSKALRPRYLRYRPSTSESSSRRGTPILRATAGAFCWTFLSLAAILPLTVLLTRSLPLRSYLDVWQTAKEEVGASLFLAATVTLAALALGLAMAYFGRASSKMRNAYALSSVAFMISGPVLALSLIRLWDHNGWRAYVYDTPLVLIFACLARYLFIIYFGLRAALAHIDPALEEAAEISAAPWWRQMRGITLPAVGPTLVATAGITFILVLSDLDLAAMVSPPGFTTLSTRIFSLMHYGPSSLVAALSIITVSCALVAAALSYLAFHHLKNHSPQS